MLSIKNYVFGNSSQFQLYTSNGRKPSISSLLFFASLYIGALLFATFLTPYVFDSIQRLAANHPTTFLTYIAQKPIDRYFDRLRWIPVLISIPFIFRYFSLTSLKALKIDFQLKRLLSRGLLIGASLTGLLALIQSRFLTIVPKPDFNIYKITTTIVSSFCSAVTVSLLEDLLFLGLILRIFYSLCGPWRALFIAALVFTYMHFKPIYPFINENPGFINGVLFTIKAAVGLQSKIDPIVFTNLFLLSIFLGFNFLKSASLLLPMGIHIGMVWVLLLYRKCYLLESNSYSFWLGSSKFVDGILMGIILIVSLVVSVIVTRHSSLSSDT
jgi:membrane protease YdiL (CAAX protease family)